MAELKHRICERCWFDVVLVRDTRPQGVGEDMTLRMPVQVIGREPAPCCVCGGLCVTSIFFRRHQDDLRCRGRHDDWASWANVNPAPSP